MVNYLVARGAAGVGDAWGVLQLSNRMVHFLIARGAAVVGEACGGAGDA